MRKTVKIDKFCIIYPIFYTSFCFYCSHKNNLTKFFFIQCKCSNNTSAISKQTENQSLTSFRGCIKPAEI